MSKIAWLPAVVVGCLLLSVSACAGDAPRESVRHRGPMAVAEPAEQPGDAAWPPVPVADPDPVVIEIPQDWPEADKARAREWITIEQDTRQCQLQRGIDYRYVPVWSFTLSEDGSESIPGPPPEDWDAHLQRPFQWFRNSAVVCFNRALVASGRAPNGPVDFAPRQPRFEVTDFVDAVTLDMPADWTDQERADELTNWNVELAIRACMAGAGYPSYGEPPFWKQTDAWRADDPWVNSLPLSEQPAAEAALSGADPFANQPYDWQQGGCDGVGNHAVRGDES